MTDKPIRIRLSRAKGWKMPANTVKVDRTTPLGNPFKVGIDGTRAECVEYHKAVLARWFCVTRKATIEEQQAHYDAVKAARETHRGKNLACWCALDGPCHADTLLEVFNA